MTKGHTGTLTHRRAVPLNGLLSARATGPSRNIGSGPPERPSFLLKIWILMCSVLILSVTDYSWNCKPFARQIKSILQIKHSPQHGNHPVVTSDLAYYSKSLLHLVKLLYCFLYAKRRRALERKKERSGEVESHTIKKILKIHCAFRDSVNGTTMTSVGTVETFRQGVVCSVL